VSSDVGSAGLGLVPAAPGRPVQAVGDGVFVVVDEGQESAYLGEGERDESSMDGWRGLRFGRLAGWIVVFI
jgi:hypothetical protein